MPALSTCHTLGLMNEINKSRVEKSGVNEGMEHTHIHKERAGMDMGNFSKHPLVIQANTQLQQTSNLNCIPIQEDGKNIHTNL